MSLYKTWCQNLSVRALMRALWTWWSTLQRLRGRNIHSVLNTSLYSLPMPAVRLGLSDEIEIFLGSVFSSLSVCRSRVLTKRPAELVNVMITSNSGCDLRPPVDAYAFKCEAKQCSLEAALTASRCAACAFIQMWRGFVFHFFRFIIRLSRLSLQVSQCRRFIVGFIKIFSSFTYRRRHLEMIKRSLEEQERRSSGKLWDLIIRTKSLKSMSSSSFPQNRLVYGLSFIGLVQAPEPLPAQRDREHVLFSLGSFIFWWTLAVFD